MNKKDLIDSIAETTGLKKTEVTSVFESIIAVITGEVQNGGDVTVTGFGKFYTKEKSARTARNPKTGASVEVPASKGLAFRPSKELKAF